MASEQERPDVAARRAGWNAARPFIDPERLVFIDETGVNTKMTRLYGRARRGERVKGVAPFGHWKTMTFVPALRLDGITAPWLLDGAMGGEAFRKLKALLRHNPARTIDALWQRLGTILDTFTATECANFFRHAKYQHSM